MCCCCRLGQDTLVKDIFNLNEAFPGWIHLNKLNKWTKQQIIKPVTYHRRQRMLWGSFLFIPSSDIASFTAPHCVDVMYSLSSLNYKTSSALRTNCHYLYTIYSTLLSTHTTADTSVSPLPPDVVFQFPQLTLAAQFILGWHLNSFSGLKFGQNLQIISALPLPINSVYPQTEAYFIQRFSLHRHFNFVNVCNLTPASTTLQTSEARTWNQFFLPVLTCILASCGNKTYK